MNMCLLACLLVAPSPVNSFSTNTTHAESFVRLQLRKLWRQCTAVCLSRRTSLVREQSERKQREQAMDSLGVWWKKSKAGGALPKTSADGSSGTADGDSNSKQSAATTTGTGAAATTDTDPLKVVTSMSALAKRVRARADDWQHARVVQTKLLFLSCRVRLPSRPEVRGYAAEARRLRLSRSATALEAQISRSATVSSTLRKLQLIQREKQRRRRFLRHIEFDAW